MSRALMKRRPQPRVQVDDLELLNGPHEVSCLPWGARGTARRLKPKRAFYIGRASSWWHAVHTGPDGQPTAEGLQHAVEFERRAQERKA